MNRPAAWQRAQAAGLGRTKKIGSEFYTVSRAMRASGARCRRQRARLLNLKIRTEGWAGKGPHRGLGGERIAQRAEKQKECNVALVLKYEGD